MSRSVIIGGMVTAFWAVIASYSLKLRLYVELYNVSTCRGLSGSVYGTFHQCLCALRRLFALLSVFAVFQFGGGVM